MKSSRVNLVAKQKPFVLPSKGAFSMSTPRKLVSGATTSTHSGSKPAQDTPKDTNTPQKTPLNSSNDPKMINWGIESTAAAYQSVNQCSFMSPPKESYTSPIREHHTSGLSANLIPTELSSFRPSKKFTPRSNTSQQFRESHRYETPNAKFKSGQRLYDEMKFTMDPHLKEDKGFRYHILPSNSVQNEPISDSNMHRHIKSVIDNIQPDWFDHQKRDRSNHLMDSYIKKLDTSTDEATSFVKYMSVDRRQPKATNKKVSVDKNASVDGIASILGHAYLYSDTYDNKDSARNRDARKQDSARDRDRSGYSSTRVDPARLNRSSLDVPYSQRRSVETERRPRTSIGTQVFETARGSLTSGASPSRNRNLLMQQNGERERNDQHESGIPSYKRKLREVDMRCDSDRSSMNYYSTPSRDKPRS